MPSPHGSASDRFWLTWLSTVSAGVMLFGLCLVLFPKMALRGFSLLVYSSPGHIQTFGATAVQYIVLTHAVLGAVMFGWGLLLLLLVLGPMRRKSRATWQIFLISLTAWFVPDTAFSLLSGFWPNALLNLVFAIFFALPLFMIHRQGLE